MSYERKAGNALNNAKTAMSIAKGAAAAGLHGAAAGAASQLLPGIVKAAAISILVLLLLPTIIFSALPNILFGYDNALASDIIEFTDKAYSIDAAYKKVDTYTLEEIEKIVGRYIEAYTSEDGVPNFDEVDVDTDTDNTNIYWFIAINSVVHQQDLFTMSEASIRDGVIGKIVSFAELLISFIFDGSNVTTIRTLRIDIKDLDPEALMDKLRFTDEERNWAHLLYSAISEEQHVGVEDTDGAGYYNTNYGNIVFINASTPVVYYNQTDSRWGNLPYGRTGTIGSAGCGPTSLAMVVATFLDRDITPVEVAQFAVANGYRVEGSGSRRTLMTNGAIHYGLQVESIGRDAAKLVEALKDGKLIIAIMNAGHFTSRGHFIVLRGVTADGKILVADSASYRRSNQEWDLRIIMGEASRNTGSGGPFWVYAP